ncbi:hypothetical protein [Rossellomorea arthrocnemi]|uniref:hypothetical protein n=1 Tax=Rossellomorea arthrocnemi TaxID=2769542 RepID=UPI00191853F2|nr:hypothetical protein [Rossellomorea arthrocnemi]
MDHKKTEFELGGNALTGVIVTFVTLAGTALGMKYMDDRKKIEIIKSEKPLKDKSDTTVEIDPKTWKVKVNRKTDFEVTETKIKEVPVVPGFKKTKKVLVQLDKNGNEIPGTEADVVG